RTSQCNAMGVGHACRDPRLRPSYSTACVTSPLKTWLRNDSALLSIAGDSACRVDPVNRRKLNSINCVRGGRRYRLRAQGDFCAIAFDVMTLKASKLTSYTLPQKVAGNGGRSVTWAG